MTDYTKLVEALRYCEFRWSARTCDNCEYSKTDCQLLLGDAADAIEELQSEIRQSMQRCAECGDELAQQLPKRGKWIEDATTYAGPGLSNYKCSLCGKICGTWRRGLEPSELPNWCGNCGADMRAKMEVQE